MSGLRSHGWAGWRFFCRQSITLVAVERHTSGGGAPSPMSGGVGGAGVGLRDRFAAGVGVRDAKELGVDECRGGGMGGLD